LLVACGLLVAAAQVAAGSTGTGVAILVCPLAALMSPPVDPRLIGSCSSD